MRDSLMDGKTSLRRSMISLIPSLCTSSCPVKKHQSLDQRTQCSVPELYSLDHSFTVHSNKVYYSGQLTVQIAKTADGQKPLSQDWATVWAQLRGTILTIWDSKEIEKAAKHGMEVSPNYICINDAYIDVFNFISTGSPPKIYHNVITLNSARANHIVVSCPSEEELVSWVTALRLAYWERSRLCEIYTAHLIWNTLDFDRSCSPLCDGQKQGWVKVLVAGGDQWQRLWMVVDRGEEEMSSIPLRESHSKDKNKWNFFSPSISHPKTSQIILCGSPSRNDKREPLFKMIDVTQAYVTSLWQSDQASANTPIKVQGRYALREKPPNDGWMLVLPDLPKSATQNPIVETLKWTVGIHDAFGLYGRPVSYRWSRYDPYSLMFASPEGADADQLFLSRESAEVLPIRESRTSVIHAQLTDILVEEIKAQTPIFEEMHLIDSPLDEYLSGARSTSVASTRLSDSPTLCESDSTSKESLADFEANPNRADHRGFPETDFADAPGRHSGYEVGIRGGAVRILYY